MWKCIFGWHLWGKWSEPKRENVIGDDGTVGWVMEQTCKCRICGKVKIAWL